MTKTRQAGTALFVLLVAVVVLPSTITVAEPSASTKAAFQSYVAEAEARVTAERSSPSNFLFIDSLQGDQRAEVLSHLQRGESVIESHGKTPTRVPGGLIHDWVGTVFIPGAKVEQVVLLLQDYDHVARYYSPDVVQSRTISRDGNDFKVFMRLRKHRVVTVILDTDYDVHYGQLDAGHQFSFSRSTNVSEVADAGSRSEHDLPSDHGFMWRLNSYWAFEQVADGVLVECEAISLTRDVPTGLGWLIGPFVQSIPRESLEFTLNATRAAVVPIAANRR